MASTIATAAAESAASDCNAKGTKVPIQIQIAIKKSEIEAFLGQLPTHELSYLSPNPECSIQGKAYLTGVVPAGAVFTDVYRRYSLALLASCKTNALVGIVPPTECEDSDDYILLQRRRDPLPLDACPPLRVKWDQAWAARLATEVLAFVDGMDLSHGEAAGHTILRLWPDSVTGWADCLLRARAHGLEPRPGSPELKGGATWCVLAHTGLHHRWASAQDKFAATLESLLGYLPATEYAADGSALVALVPTRVLKDRRLAVLPPIFDGHKASYTHDEHPCRPTTSTRRDPSDKPQARGALPTSHHRRHPPPAPRH